MVLPREEQHTLVAVRSSQAAAEEEVRRRHSLVLVALATKLHTVSEAGTSIMSTVQIASRQVLWRAAAACRRSNSFHRVLHPSAALASSGSALPTASRQWFSSYPPHHVVGLPSLSPVCRIVLRCVFVRIDLFDSLYCTLDFHYR